MPTARAAATSVVYGNDIYVIGDIMSLSLFQKWFPILIVLIVNRWLTINASL